MLTRCFMLSIWLAFNLSTALKFSSAASRSPLLKYSKPRRFRVGYNRAARIMDQLEARGVIGPQDGARPRKVLISEEEFTEH